MNNTEIKYRVLYNDKNMAIGFTTKQEDELAKQLNEEFNSKLAKEIFINNQQNLNTMNEINGQREITLFEEFSTNVRVQLSVIHEQNYKLKSKIDKILIADPTPESTDEMKFKTPTCFIDELSFLSRSLQNEIDFKEEQLKRLNQII